MSVNLRAQAAGKTNSAVVAVTMAASQSIAESSTVRIAFGGRRVDISTTSCNSGSQNQDDEDEVTRVVQSAQSPRGPPAGAGTARVVPEGGPPPRGSIDAGQPRGSRPSVSIALPSDGATAAATSTMLARRAGVVEVPRGPAQHRGASQCVWQCVCVRAVGTRTPFPLPRAAVVSGTQPLVPLPTPPHPHHHHPPPAPNKHTHIRMRTSPHSCPHCFPHPAAAGWRLIQRLGWLPTAMSRPVFRADVLRATIRAKGKPSAVFRYLRKAMAVVPVHQFWKKGSIVVVASGMSRPVFLVSSVLMTVGLVLVGVGAAGMRRAGVDGFPIAAVGSFVLVMGAMGAYGAWKRAEVVSCLVLTYFYMLLLSLGGVCLAAVWWYAFPVSVESFVDTNWNTIKMVFPTAAAHGGTASNRTEAMEKFRSNLSGTVTLESVVLYIFVMLLVRAVGPRGAAGRVRPS
jgi:hypothetical protein